MVQTASAAARISSTVSPCLFYRDAGAAIAWLERVFGFETVLRVDGEDGSVMHAELLLNGGVVMLGTARPEQKWMSPLDLPAIHAMTCWVLDDADAHYQRAVAGGATIIRPVQDEDYGGRDYLARDPEGNVWCFGTYRPGGSRPAA